jgi:hypothetical protein
MSRLARLNEKNAKQTREKPPLEIEDKTTVIIEEDATKRDSAWWAEARPIPLTREESASLSSVPAGRATACRRDTATLSITIGPDPGRDRIQSPDRTPSGRRRAPLPGS